MRDKESLSYEQITAVTEDQIKRCMTDANKFKFGEITHTIYQEKACGILLLWVGLFGYIDGSDYDRLDALIWGEQNIKTALPVNALSPDQNTLGGTQ